MTDDDRTQRLDPWDRQTRRLSPQEAEPTRRVPPQEADPTRRLGPIEDPEPTRRYAVADEWDDRGTIVLPDEQYGPSLTSRPQRPQPPPNGEGADPGLPRWALPLVTAVIGAIGGILLVLLLSGANRNDVVPRQALVEQQAQAAAALQDAQAQISSRDARIAELEQQLAQLSENQNQAATAQQQALDARQQALDERESALNAREQALDQREEAADGDGVLPNPDLPGIDLPDVNLPDVDLPEQEARNLLQRFLDLIRGAGDQPA